MQVTGEFLDTWAAAEQAGDTSVLDTPLVGDFSAVGLLGFIIPRHAWLARHRTRDLTFPAFSLDEVQDSPIGQDAVVATARVNARGSYQRHPIPEATTRATLILASDASRWQLAAIHMSVIAGTGAAPPVPGPGSGQPSGQGGAA